MRARAAGAESRPADVFPRWVETRIGARGDGAGRSSAGRANGLVGGVQRKLVGKPVIHGWLSALTAQADPFGQSDSVIMIAQGGESAHTEPDQDGYHDCGCDHDEEHGSLRLGDLGGETSPSVMPLRLAPSTAGAVEVNQGTSSRRPAENA
jgi:hypothetical protein